MHTVDDTDRRILLAMTENPRATIVSLAQSLGMSRNTIQARLAALDGAARDGFFALGGASSAPLAEESVPRPGGAGIAGDYGALAAWLAARIV